MLKYHTTKEGKRIPLCDLEDSHLDKILSLIKRRAKKGIVRRFGGGSMEGDMWYDEETIYGYKVLALLDYDSYLLELKKRKKRNENKSSNCK